MKTPPLLLVGDGGHATVVLDLARALGRSVRGCTGLDPRHARTIEIAHLGTDAALAAIDPSTVELVVALGGVRADGRRMACFDRWRAQGFTFATLVHPSAIVSEGALLGAGVQVMAGAIVQTGARVGDCALVNTGAIVEHHATVGPGAHIAPGAVVCGDVAIGAAAHVGARATVLQGLRVGAKTTVGAGAVVCADLPHSGVAVGVPARLVSGGRDA